MNRLNQRVASNYLRRVRAEYNDLQNPHDLLINFFALIIAQMRTIEGYKSEDPTFFNVASFIMNNPEEVGSVLYGWKDIELTEEVRETIESGSSCHNVDMCDLTKAWDLSPYYQSGRTSLFSTQDYALS
jgi:hypothetical protein